MIYGSKFMKSVSMKEINNIKNTMFAVDSSICECSSSCLIYIYI